MGDYWQNVRKVFEKRDKETELLWAVIIAWTNFIFLYWGLHSSSNLAVNGGLLMLALACGLVLYFG